MHILRGEDSNFGPSGYEPNNLTADIPRDIQESGHRQRRNATDARMLSFGVSIV